MDAEIEKIEQEHQPDRHGRAWMRNTLKYQHGEDLLEFGFGHVDSLPADYFDFDEELLTVGPYDFECSQYYDDFMPKYHIRHVLGQREDFALLVEQVERNDQEGMQSAFEYLHRHIEDELV